MIDHTGWTVFLGAAVSLAIVPGPAVLFIIARSVEQGRTAGIVSVSGMAVGSLIHVGAAAVGLSAVLMTSAVAFSVVKYAGAIYLIYLGIRTMLGGKPVDTRKEDTETYRTLSRVFRQAFLVNLLNPKTALFFLAFLPQFVVPDGFPGSVQIVVLGAVFVAVALVTDSIYAIVSGTAGRELNIRANLAGRLRFVSGSIYIALGVGTAIVDIRR